MTDPTHPSSLRDPAGQLMQFEGRLTRRVYPEYADQYRRILDSSWLWELMRKGEVADTRQLPAAEVPIPCRSGDTGGLYLEHEVISFPSYPTEWPLEMLCAAARLTLQLCIASLPYGAGLKDATPSNVLFRGAQPVFVDILSFEERNPNDPNWMAYGQFVRTFLLPALLDSRYAIPSHTTFLSRRDGVEPEEVYRMLGRVARLTPPFLGNVTIPVLLSGQAKRRNASMYASRLLANRDQAAFVLRSRYAGLLRKIEAAAIRKKSSRAWVDYNETCTYDAAAFAQKSNFVESFLQGENPERTLDIGCNTGHFSFLAAKVGSQVVSIDSDPEVVGRLWKVAYNQKSDILPLVVSLSRPTPSLGWRNRENSSFLQRCTGYFDAVLMLAVVHHLLVTDQIPLEEIFDLAAEITNRWLIIEYVGVGDPQFTRLLRGREMLYSWFTRDVFEKKLSERFVILKQEQVSGSGRWLYVARSRNDR